MLCTMIGVLILLAFGWVTGPAAYAETVTSDVCQVVPNSPNELVLSCGADDQPLVLTLPDLAAGGYDGGALSQGDYTTTLVWMRFLGGVTHSPVWRYLTADGSSVCQIDGRPSSLPGFGRSCLSLDPANL